MREHELEVTVKRGAAAMRIKDSLCLHTAIYIYSHLAFKNLYLCMCLYCWVLMISINTCIIVPA